MFLGNCFRPFLSARMRLLGVFAGAAIMCLSPADAAVVLSSTADDYTFANNNPDTVNMPLGYDTDGYRSGMTPADAFAGSFQLGEIRSLTDVDDDNTNISNGTRSDAVYVFELPVLTGVISNANLSFQALSSAGLPNALNNIRVDLKGLGFQSTFTAVTTFSGSTLLEDDIIVGSVLRPLLNSSAPVTVETDSLGDAALAAYLQTFYAANPTYAGGSIVLLGLDQTATVFDNAHFNVDSNEFAGSTPTLTIETETVVIPEPASLALLGLGGLCLLPRRRR